MPRLGSILLESLNRTHFGGIQISSKRMIEFWPGLPPAIKPLGRCIPTDFSADLARWKLSKRMAGREYAPCCAMAPQLRVFRKILCLHLWKFAWNPNIGFVDVSSFPRGIFRFHLCFLGCMSKKEDPIFPCLHIKKTSESSIKRTHACSLHFVSVVVASYHGVWSRNQIWSYWVCIFLFLCIISRYFRGSILDISRQQLRFCNHGKIRQPWHSIALAIMIFQVRSWRCHHLIWTNF